MIEVSVFDAKPYDRKIHRAYNRVRELNFSLSGLVGFDIFDKTVGIIGTGKTGQITAQILRGFEAKVVAFDPFPLSDWATAHAIKYVDMDSVLLDDELSRLLMFPNVLVTSHQAFFTHEALSEIARVTTANLLSLMNCQPYLEGTAISLRR